MQVRPSATRESRHSLGSLFYLGAPIDAVGGRLDGTSISGSTHRMLGSTLIWTATLGELG